MKERLFYISFLQFIGPIFVIFGHAMNGIAMNDAMLGLKAWVYIFHMPLFFFMSGYLFSYNGGFTKYSYGELVKKKAFVLLTPYLVWNFVFLIPKILLSDRHLLSGEYFLNLLLVPKANIWGHTWFLFALFEIYVLSYALNYLSKRKIGMIVTTAALLLLNFFKVESMVLCANDLMRNLIFFWIGMLLAGMQPSALEGGTGRSRKLFALFTVTAVASTALWKLGGGMKINDFIVCSSVLLLLFYLPMAFNVTNNFIEYAAKNSFGIYILHWPCIVIMRFIVYQTLHLGAMPAFFILLVSGWALPVLMIETIRRIRFLKNIKALKYIMGI